MTKQFLALTVAALPLFALNAKAQKTEPAFEISAGNVITNTKFLVQANTGELLTGNDLKLMCIDPVSKKIIWEKSEFLGLDEDDIEVIEGTPFIKIERQKTFSLSKNKNTIIIQANDGKEVFNSKEEGIKVKSTLNMPQINGMLIELIKDGFLSVSFIDYGAAKELWTVPLAKQKTGGIGLGALSRAMSSHVNSAFNVPPIVDANQNVILVNKKEIFSISRTGVLNWKKEIESNVDDAYLSKEGNALFIGYKKYIDKLNTATGNSELKDAIKMKDELNGILPMGDDYIVYNKKGINKMDAAGNMKWKKDATVGNINQVKFTETGILAIEGDDKNTKLIWVDKTGKEIWDEKVDGALVVAEPTAKGVMYITQERANILTYEKGKDVWNKDIKMKGMPHFGKDEKNNTIYAFANKKLHSFNLNDVSYKQIAEDIKLKRFKDEEEVATLDIRENGVCVISSNQDVAAVNIADGALLYNNSFEEIGAKRKRLMRAFGTAVKVFGAAKGLSVVSKGNINLTPTGAANTYTVNTNSRIAENSSGLGNDLVSAARSRYLASQKTKDKLYILSQMKEGNGILIWDKAKGEIAQKITFNDITPQYVVDESVDMLYVVVGNTIKAYTLK